MIICTLWPGENGEYVTKYGANPLIFGLSTVRFSMIRGNVVRPV